ncbi:hypothetical protein F5Y01DRAFT_318770 [Xylaria sp. FL0043]|nr:hypothetical protein F5Y01DRAFT_318770 [Xylaria sp. FL0043]
MRIPSYIILAATLATQAAAESKVIGPFGLRITKKTTSGGGARSTDSDIDGWAWGCHAGAATQGLCYAAGSGAVSGSVYEFYYNYTYDDAYTYPGYISYLFPYQDSNGDLVKLASFLQLYPSWASNVNLALIPPGMDGGTLISLDTDTGLFYMSSPYDDTHANATPPSPGPSRNISNFHICYQWTGGYWYRSLAWVSGFEGAAPQNPSCEPVNLGIESLAASS